MAELCPKPGQACVFPLASLRKCYALAFMPGSAPGAGHKRIFRSARHGFGPRQRAED
ncbi:hypothetical protein L501_1342 [Bordetella holmesii CDC-H719-BH]|nr:hypothetical protein L501_1342 [Bordetella holmesii CDC-H719-BH]